MRRTAGYCAGQFARGFGSLHISFVIVGVTAVLGCSDDDGRRMDTGGTGGLVNGTGVNDGGAAGGKAGATSSGGKASAGAPGNGGGGVASAGGRSSAGGGTSGGGATASGGTAPSAAGGSATAGQPIGALCVNDSNCSQAQGTSVCCATPGCAGPCECRLAADCPESGLFLECKGAADCSAFGGGKVCCQVGSGSQTMQYCTKPSGCPGVVLP